MQGGQGTVTRMAVDHLAVSLPTRVTRQPYVPPPGPVKSGPLPNNLRRPGHAGCTPRKNGFEYTLMTLRLSRRRDTPHAGLPGRLSKPPTPHSKRFFLCVPPSGEPLG